MKKPHIRLHATTSGAWATTITAHGFKPTHHGYYGTVRDTLNDAYMIIERLCHERNSVNRMFKMFE